MATINGSTSSSQWTYKLEVTEGSININNNTSPVTVKAYLGRASSRSYLGGKWSGSITVDGSSQSMSGTIPYPTYIDGGGWYLLATKTFTVSHNADGSKRASVSSSLSSSEFTPSSASASGSITLTTIPRQANLNSAPNFYDDENPTITYTNTAGNAVSELRACIATEDGQTILVPYRDISKTGSSYTFNLTEAERNTLRQATLSGSNRKNVKFYIRTIIGGNYYYSTLARTLTIANATPTVTATMEDINETTLNLTKDNQVIIKNNSVVKITPTTQTFKGASIVSLTVNGVNVLGNDITLLGNDKYEVIATDNRGLSSKFTFQSSNPQGANYFELINYNPLSLNATFGRKAPTTGEVDVVYSGNYYNGDFSEEISNSLTLKYRFKEIYEEWEDIWYDLTPLIENNTFENEEILSQLFDYQKNYIFEIKAEDLLSTALITNITVTKGIPIINWDDDFLNVNGEIKQNDSPIIEKGTNENGSWIKYANGIMICYGHHVSEGMNLLTEWGSFYESDQRINLGYLPQEFIEPPEVFMQPKSVFFIERVNNLNPLTTWGEYYPCRPVRTYSWNFGVSLLAIGKWK